MIKRSYLAAAIVAVSLSAAPAAANIQLPTPTPTSPVVAANAQSAHLNQLKTQGVAELDRRSGELQGALGRVKVSTTMPTDQKATLATALQTEIDALGQIKSRLGSRTDLALARTDIQAVLNDYHVYGLLLPHAQTATAVDRLIQAERSLKNILDQLELKKQALVKANKDTAALEQAITSARTKLDAADSAIMAASDGVKTVPQSTGDYAEAYKLLAGYRAGLTVARLHLDAARGYVNAGIDALGTSSNTDQKTAS